ncbi:MAG: hypothetical protein IJ802_00465, partial [Kiritimatiellae bacterium]|nr:hypothetical protein [Kiritimatiellia bacterium]
LVCTGDKEREMSLTFTTTGVTGDFEEWTVDGVRERLKGSKADKVLAKTELAKWQGAWVATAANEDAGLVMSVKVSAAGKVAAKAYASSGTMASASGSLILGENCAIAPLVFKKEISGIGGFSCAVWFDASSPQLLYLPDGVEQTAFGKAGASVLFEDSAIFNINLDALADMDGILDEFSPDGVEVSRKGARLVLPKAGRVKYSRAEEDFVLSSGGEDNPAALKLTYPASTGLVKGSFKIYQAVSETRLKTWSATLWGAMIDGAASGTATVKALKLSMPFTIE